MEYLCRSCCGKKGIFFNGDALNEVGRKNCLMCHDSSSTPLHILTKEDIVVLQRQDMTNVREKIIDQAKKEDEAGYFTKVSLRDYFAIEAMNAIIIGNKADISIYSLGAAKDAYIIADNMLEIRKETAPEV